MSFVLGVSKEFQTALNFKIFLTLISNEAIDDLPATPAAHQKLPWSYARHENNVCQWVFLIDALFNSGLNSGREKLNTITQGRHKIDQHKKKEDSSIILLDQLFSIEDLNIDKVEIIRQCGGREFHNFCALNNLNYRYREKTKKHYQKCSFTSNSNNISFLGRALYANEIENELRDTTISVRVEEWMDV